MRKILKWIRRWININDPQPWKMNKIKGAFDKVVEWDKELIKKCQDKFGLTDYQVVCISFAKGFIIGAILL